MSEQETESNPPLKETKGSGELSQSDTVKLYGLSAGRCAICKTKLVRENEYSGKAYNLGKRAHMAAKSDGGPRADPALTPAERALLSNHVLLCGTHHDEVDLDVEAWPIERLRKLRDDHIAWIDAKLDGPEIDHERLVYAKVIDQAQELVWIDAWTRWTEGMLDPYLSWRRSQIENVAEFARLVIVTDWPGTIPELEVALCRLAYLLGRAQKSFLSRAEPRHENELHVFRNYKRQGWNENYHRDAKLFGQWLGEYEGMVLEATDAANWVRSAWRSAGNPQFLAEEKLSLITYPDVNNRHTTYIGEYGQGEKQALLDAGRERIDTVPLKTFGSLNDPLQRLLREIFEAVLGEDPAPDVITEISDQLHRLEGRTDSGQLFGDLPGRAIPMRAAKRLSQELFRNGVLARNPDPEARGYVLGDLP
jgi:hypothetical protein